jgi:DNA repair photolyase
VERKLELTRSILKELLDYHQPKLVIQTRGTLVTRDIDLLQQFEHVQVNMTITTDDLDVRQTFEPMCPSTQQRLNAITQVREAGIPAIITMTPLLPVRDPKSFADALLETGVSRFVVQDFHSGKVRFAAGTGEAARAIASSMGWDHHAYRETVNVLKTVLPDVREGQKGFVPEWNT